MKKAFLFIFLLALPNLALAQSNRNPCAYLSTNNGNCLAIGYYLAGVTGVPMPVGGIANAAAPTFTEAKPGYLSFDLSGNLRVVSSGSGGGAVTIADGADVAEGATTDAASTAGGIGTVSSKLRLMTTQLGTINTTLGSPFQAGGSIANTSFIATQATASSLNATVVGTGTFATQLTGVTNNINNISGTISLPSLASTSTKQSDGSQKSQIVDGSGNVISATANALDVNLKSGSVSGLTQAPIAPGAATATKSDVIGCQYNSTTLAFTNGQQGQVGCGPNGGLAIQDGQAIPSVSVTSATTLFTVADTSGYGSISLQVTSAGSATITYESSEDGTIWITTAGYNPASTGTSASVTTSTTATQLIFPLLGKQYRARVSAYTSGTVTIQGTLKKDTIARNSIAIGNNVTVVGNTAEAAAVGSTSVQTSYEGRTTNKTAVATGQNVRPIATSIGVAVNKPFQVPELDWSYPAAAGGISNTTTAVTMVGAAGAGIRNYLTAIQVSAGALGAASEIAVRDGAGGTVIWRGFISTAGGNQSVNLSSPIKSTANTLLEVVTLTATITGAVYINAQGYQAP